MNKFIIAIGAGVVAASIYGYKKLQDYTTVVDQMTVSFFDVSQIDLSALNFNDLFSGATNWINIDIKLKITNPTDIDFVINTIGLVTIKKVLVYDSTNKLIGTAIVDETRMKIPAHGFSTTKWLPLQLPVENLVNSFLSSVDPNQFTYKVIINIAGAGDYTIG